MSLRQFFKSRTGKALIGITAAFNITSFASSAALASQVSKYARDNNTPISKMEGLVAAAITPAISGLNPILREGRITGIFERGATPNDWIDNTVVTVAAPVVGYDNAGVAAMGVMIVDNAVSFPGSIVGAVAGYTWDRTTGGKFVPELSFGPQR